MSRAFGFALVLAVSLFSAIGPVVIPADPAAQDLSAYLSPPSAAHPLGTDHLGRDLLARLAHAGRLSLGLAVLSVACAALPGVALGLAAAWRGGLTDRVLATAADMTMALPGLLIVLLVAGLAPGRIWPLWLGLSAALWVEYFRLTRATARVLLAAPEVEASRLLGFGPLYILRRHVVPALAPPLATLAAFGVGGAVMAIGALGFVGIGLRPPMAEWGLMLTELLPHYHEAPWALTWPALMVFATVFGLQLIASESAQGAGESPR